MFIYLIWQNETCKYDTYDSAIVVAATPADASRIHPSREKDEWWKDEWSARDWAHPNNVKVEKVGVVTGDLGDKYSVGEVLCASYNAG